MLFELIGNINIRLAKIMESDLDPVQRVFDSAHKYHTEIISTPSTGAASLCFNRQAPRGSAARVFKYFLVIIDNSNEKYIGVIDMYVSHPAYNIATIPCFIIDEKIQRKGFGSQALNLLSSFLKSKHPAVQYLYAAATDNNIPANRFLKKSGFRQTAVWEKIHTQKRDLTAVRWALDLKNPPEEIKNTD